MDNINLPNNLSSLEVKNDIQSYENIDFENNEELSDYYENFYN